MCQKMEQISTKLKIEVQFLSFCPYENEEIINIGHCFLSFLIDEEFNRKMLLEEENKTSKVFKLKELVSITNKVVNLNAQDGSFTFRLKKTEDSSCLTKWFKLNLEVVKTSKGIKEKVQEMIEFSYKIQIKKHRELDFNSHQYLARRIKNFIDQFDTNYYGPFTTLCQSSGFGKTRACEALVNDNFYVVYCCLRKSKSSGFPPRSPAADFIQSSNSNEILIRKFICYLNLFIETAQKASNENVTCNKFYENFNDDAYLLKLLDDKLKVTSTDSELGVYLGKNQLVFIFDESSSLLETKLNGTNTYFILRRVLSKLAGNVFVLFLDTFTNLSEYHPQKEADPSARISSLEKTLFEPIYLLPNWDLFVDYDLIKSIKETVLFESICRFGRVLWGSLMFTKLNCYEKFKNVSDDDIYDLAISKLLGGRVWSSSVLDDNECLAALSCRLGTIKSKNVSTSQDLVAKNMAICTHVSTPNDIFEIEYSSEPVLAVASAYLINSFGFDKVMDSLMRSVESSIIALGDRGEMIAKFILIYIIDKVTSSKTSKNAYKYLKITKVGEFIQELYGKCITGCGSEENGWRCENIKAGEASICPIQIINSQIENYFELLNGLINFNHFLKVNFALTEASLEKSLKRCAAIHCRFSQTGIDLVIPVCLDPDNFSSISAIMVQVKLHSKTIEYDFAKAFDSISPKLFNDLDSNKPYLLLFMQLNENPVRKSFIQNIKTQRESGKEYPKRAIIYSEGLSKNVFPNLGDNFIQKLKNFSSFYGSSTYEDDENIYKTISGSIMI